MAAGANIPKTMVIIPMFKGVTAFVRDAGLVSGSVKKMTTDVNASIKSLSKTPASVTKTNTEIKNLTSSLSKNFASLGRWARGFDLTNNSIARVGASLSHLSRGITRFSFQMERVGRSLFLGLTLPVIAAGYATITASKDFESALVKIETLVGVNTDVVKDWGDQILETANDLAILPVDMAKGLFAVASGFGSVAAQAPVMDVLTASVKASVLGLGSVEEVGRAATAMMNAFGKEYLSAEQAVSLLVLGVREGNLEVDKLSTAVGNVLGTAAALGAGADDVLAFISAYTRFGVDPSRAVTALNTAFTNLIKPSGKSKEILDAWGLSAEEIKKTIAGPGGLAQLFVSMRQSMPDQDFIEIFGLRSLRAVLAVTGTEMNQFYNEYIRIADLMQEEASTGIYTAMAMEQEKGSYAYQWYMEMAERVGEKTISTLTEAWTTYANTLEKRFGVIKSQIQSAFIGIGNAIYPALKKLTDQIIESLDKLNIFVRENQKTVEFIAKIGLALATLGPLLIIFSRISQAFGVLVGIAGAFVSLIGKSIAIISNFTFHLVRLSIVTGIHLVKAFWAIGVAVSRATIAIITFAGKMIGVMAIQVADWLATVVLHFIALGYQAVAAGIAVGVTLVGQFITAAAAAVPLLLSISGIVAALAVIGVTAGAIILGIGAVFNALDNMFGDIKEIFSGLNEKSDEWGEGLTIQYSNGIIRGAAYVVRALTSLGNWIIDLLAPSSPPKLLPKIDQWGTQTMQLWIDGWALADFSVFNDIADTIKDFLTSMIPETKDGDEKKGIINSVLGSRGLIAEAVNQMKKFGSVSTEALQNIYTAIGTTTLELENYIEAMLVAAGTTQKLADAQQRVNDINEKYARMLDPIQRKLSAISRERNVIAGDREIALLKRTIERENLPDRVKRLAELRMTEINLEVQQEGLEQERDAELVAAEEQVRLAEIANDAAVEQMEIARETLALQTWSADLMQDLVDIAKSTKSTLDSIAKGVDSIAGGAIDQFELPDTESIWSKIGGGGDGEGILSTLDKEIEDLQLEITTLAATWGTVWTSLTASLTTWYNDATEKLETFKDNMNTKWGPAYTTLKEEGAATWLNLTTTLGNFWDNTAIARAGISKWLRTTASKFNITLPAAIVATSLVINGLIDQLGIFLTFLTTNDLWEALFPPEEPQEDNSITTLLGQLDELMNHPSLDPIKLPEGKSQADLLVDLLPTFTHEEVLEHLGFNGFGKFFESTSWDINWDTVKEGIGFAKSGTIGSTVFDWEDFKEWSGFLNFQDDANEDLPKIFDAETILANATESIGGIFTGIGGIITTQLAPGSELDTVFQANAKAFWKFYDKLTEPPPDYDASELFAPIIEEVNGYLDAIPDMEDFNNLLSWLTGEDGFPRVTSDADDLSTGIGSTGLGGGFYALGANADIATIAAGLLKDKAIELKNNAIATLTTKTETLRAKMEEWRAKMVAVKTWVQNLIDKVTLFITGALTDLSNFLTVTVNVALEDARQLFQDIQEWIDTYTGPAVDALTAAFGFMADAISPLNDLLDTMAGLLETVVGWVAGLPDYIINWFKGGMPSLPPWLRGGDTDTDDDGKSDQQSAIPSHGIELPSPVGFGSDALPGTRGIGAATAGVGTAVSSFSAAIGTATSKARTRTSVAPSVVIGAGSTVATQGGMVMSFGDVIINNDMDMAVFEARVRNAVSNSMIN